MKIKQCIDDADNDSVVEALVSDPGFTCDIKAWCEMNSCELLELEGTAPNIKVKIKKSLKPGDSFLQRVSCKGKNALTMVVFSGDLDKVLAAFVIANGALAMGKKVTMFFTFWGLNALRKNIPQKSGKPFMDFMFGKMMPKGAENLKLSKMNIVRAGYDDDEECDEGEKSREFAIFD